MRKFCLGITGGSRRISVDGTKVALPINKRITVGELLRHVNHGVVDGLIAVRVVLTHHLADYAGRFAMRLSRCDAQFPHPKQDSSLNRLEAVSDVGNGSPTDNAHRVVDVGLLHLLFDKRSFNAFHTPPSLELKNTGFPFLMQGFAIST